MKEVDEAIKLLKPSPSIFEIKKASWSNDFEVRRVYDITPKPHDIQMKGMLMSDYIITRSVVEAAAEHFNSDTMKFEIDEESIRKDVFYGFLRQIHNFILDNSESKQSSRTKISRFLNSTHYESGSPVVELIFGAYKAMNQDILTEEKETHKKQIFAILELIREKYDKHDYTTKKNNRRRR